MFDKVTDKVREAPPPSKAPAHAAGTDGEKVAAHQKESERRGNVVNESFSIPGITKAILEHLHIQGAAPERAASTHVGTTDVMSAKMDKVAEAHRSGHGDSAGDVKQLSRRPPGGEGTQEIPQSAREALDRLVTTQRQMEGNRSGQQGGSGDQLSAAGKDKDNEQDRNSGGQDVGTVSTEQDGHHLGFRQAVETAFVNLKLRQILDKFESGPIGSTTFTHDEIESAFAVQSLTGHIVTNFQQEFASDRPPEPLGVDKLSITERDGRTLLTTPEGTALVNQQGKPVMAVELGSYLQKDGTIMVDGQGRVSRPGDLQTARSAQQEQLTANHKKEAEKVRVRQEMEASLDSVSSRDALAESMRSSRPELVQAIIDTAEQSVGEGEEESVSRTEALHLARRIIDDNEIDEIADSEFEVEAEQADSHPDQSSTDGSVEQGESGIEESMEGDSQETDDVADYSQKEVLRQGQTAILNNQQGNNADPDEDKRQAKPRSGKQQKAQSSSAQTSQTQQQQDPKQQQQQDPQQQQDHSQQTNSSQPQPEPTQSQVRLATIDKLLTDLSGIVASASANYDMVDAERSARPEPSHREPQTDTLPLPVMPRPQQQQSTEAEPAQSAHYEVQSRAAHSQVMYRTNIGEVISVSSAHVVTNMFY